jgi:hypothetical protein
LTDPAFDCSCTAAPPLEREGWFEFRREARKKRRKREEREEEGGLTQLNLNRPLRISTGPRHLSRPLAT